MKFYTIGCGPKFTTGDNLYLEKTLNSAVKNLDLYDGDTAVLYEVTLKPIKRIKRGYIELPLVSKKTKKKGKK